MGRGLVEAEDDLRETNPPSNRELLDAMTADFIKNKFDMKRLMRQIMNSAAYQRSSLKISGNEQDNRYYSRYILRRLSGEVILDAVAQVTGSPTVFNQVYTGVEGGVAATTNYPLGTRAMQLPDSRVASRFLDAFGRPDRIATCSCERQQDATVGQALMMNNGQVLNDKLRAKDSRVNAWLAAKVSDEDTIKRVFMLALNRPPTAEESKKCKSILADSMGGTAEARREALEDLFWAVLTTREFLFNH
jgi:parvulin-like peptidyl-prolyl isomerase